MRTFAQLFAGRTDCYAVYHPGNGVLREDGKNKGRGETKREPLPDGAYEQHLAGKIMLGIVPVRLDGTVAWFACDIDDYQVDITLLERKAQEMGAPLVFCRTKSGGAHGYCFTDGTLPASTAIKLMRSWAVKLGYPRCEVFPKQDHVDEDSVGNWINLPYHNAATTNRYAIDSSGNKLSLEEFIQLAEARLVRSKDVADLLKSMGESKPGRSAPGKERSWEDDAPPCIVSMAKQGIGEGGRNNTLTHVGIYLYKRFAGSNEWKDELLKFNVMYCQPQVAHGELNIIIKNISTGKYEYFCTTEPMRSFCDKDECMKRKWGVGPQRGIDYDYVEVTRIRKITSDPPIYILTIACNGAEEEVRFTTDQLLSSAKFRVRIVEATNWVITPKKKLDHDKDVTAWLKATIFEKAPEEIKTSGSVREAFRDWCIINVPKSKGAQSIKSGMPFWDQEAKELLFRGNDFINYYRNHQKGRMVSVNEIWDALRDMGAQSGTNRRTEGQQIKVWSMPVKEQWFETPKGDQF